MDVYQRAWASLLKRIEAKTSWGRNELKQQMLEALTEGIAETVYTDKYGNPMQFPAIDTGEFHYGVGPTDEEPICPYCKSPSEGGYPHISCNERAQQAIARVEDAHGR